MGIDLIKNEEEVNARLEITEEMKENLLIATKWIKFMNVVGCVSLGALAFICFIGFFSGMMGGGMSLGIMYLLSAAIYYPVLKRVFAFVNQARSACEYDSSEDLHEMFDSLRFISKYLGIIWAIVVGFWAVVIIVAIIVVIFAAIFS